MILIKEYKTEVFTGAPKRVQVELKLSAPARKIPNFGTILPNHSTLEELIVDLIPTLDDRHLTAILAAATAERLKR